MRLPPYLYKAAKPSLQHHGCWHYLRTGAVDPAQRAKCLPGLKGQREPGAGAQFLQFHRHMIRHFKWTVAHTKVPSNELKYEYRPWAHLPPWLTNLFQASEPEYLGRLRIKLDRLVAGNDLDQLGRFIEGTMDDPILGIHWLVHGIVSQYEQLMFSNDPGADMGDMATAPLNQHFWGLHGWIDNFYARWQEANGEPVDRSPIPPHPHDPLEDCEVCKKIKKRPMELLPGQRWLSLLRETQKLR